MKKLFCTILAVVLLLSFAACGPTGFEDDGLDVANMTPSSKSINSNGNLYTVVAANWEPNNPKGENRSPHLAWDKVENAVCYAVVMFDVTANWLHMLLPEINALEILEGQFTDTSVYVGPYPPAGTGKHSYRIEVFALKAKPQTLSFANDSQLSYKNIVSALNGQNNNILARGYVTGSYANGDNTKK